MAEKNTLSILESIKKKMANFDEKQARVSSAFDSDDFDYNDQGLTNNAQDMEKQSARFVPNDMLNEVQNDDQAYDDNEDLSPKNDKVAKDNEEFLFEEDDEEDDFVNEDDFVEDDQEEDFEDDDDEEEYEEENSEDLEEDEEEESSFEDPLENINVDDDDFNDDDLKLNEIGLSQEEDDMEEDYLEEEDEESDDNEDMEENQEEQEDKEDEEDFSQYVNLDAFKDDDEEDENNDEDELNDDLEDSDEAEENDSFIDDVEDDNLEEESVIAQMDEDDLDDEFSDLDLDSDDDIVDEFAPHKIRADFVQEKTKMDDDVFEEQIVVDQPEMQEPAVNNEPEPVSIKTEANIEFEDLMKNIDLDLDDEEEQQPEELEAEEELDLDLEFKDEEIAVEPVTVRTDFVEMKSVAPELEVKNTMSDMKSEVVEVESQIEDTVELNNNHNQLSAMREVGHEKPLLDEETVQKTSQSIKKLIDANKIVHGMKSFSQNGGAAFGEMALQLMEPKIEKWINDHLPDMVERIVRQEIERIIPDLNDNDES